MAINRQTILNKPKDTRRTLRRLLAYLAAYRGAMALLLFLCFTANVLSLIGPGLAGRAINAAAGVGQVDFPKVFHYAIWMLVCYGISALIIIAVNLLMTRISRRVAKVLRADAFAKLTRLPVAFFDRSQPGDILSRVFYDVDVVSTCIATDLTNILTNLITVVGSFVMMLIIAPALALIPVAAIPASVWFTARMRKKTQPLYKGRSVKYGKLNALVEEFLTGQRTIQAYAYENRAGEKFDEANAEAANGYYDAEYQGAAISPTINFISYLSLALIAMFGALLYLYGIVSLGQISSFILYSRKFSGPIDEISSILNELFSALAAAERVFQLLDEAEETESTESLSALANIQGNVVLQGVSFGYTPEKPVLRDLSFSAPAGKLVAIVGPTGAGKTTMINLLMRFYDPDSGNITLDNRDIREHSRQSVRHAYAMVLQDTWLFEGTVAENIAYGRPDAPIAEIIAAAKAAHIHPFISRLPEGYDTVIRADGENISKGEKQLLTIARALLCDADMVILDEATSNVDTDTEQRVQAAMRELMQNKTCFVIAHRLSTIRNADLILVLDNGVIVEQGTHESLMRSGGRYHQLYAAQFT